MAPTNPIAIEVKGLWKSYYSGTKKNEAVKGVSFSIKEGEIFGLLGPNGAGKTTIINILSGILLKDQGEIKILGKDPEKEREFVRNNMNVASAYFGLSNVLTLNENLKIYARLYNVKKPQERIDYLLKIFGLTELKHARTNTLSSGERTRLVLCKGLINEPKVLLLDECTVGLDPDIAERTRNIIREYHEEHKSSILFTSHYMYEVEELCKRIAFLTEGRITKIDTTSNIKKIIKKQTIEIDFINARPRLKRFFSDKGVDVLFINENAVRFDISARGTKLYKLMNSLFKEGYKIKDLRMSRPTLDDVFIQIARGNNAKKRRNAAENQKQENTDDNGESK